VTMTQGRLRGPSTTRTHRDFRLGEGGLEQVFGGLGPAGEGKTRTFSYFSFILRYFSLWFWC